MDSTERDESEEADGTEELVSLSPACVVTVQLVLPHKGTLEPCAMICLPQEEDLCSGDGVLRAREQGDPPEEPTHEDHNHDRRARMREEHCKITGRMRRVRRRARQRVAKEMDFETAAHSSQSVKAATSEALTRVMKNNEVILRKYSSYKEEMESAWLMSTSDALQCCARPILGYITHGTFSHTHGRAAGMGWVGLKPLLRLLEQCGEGRGQKGSLLEVSRKAKGLPVLVRNPSTLQYRWALLSVV
ncbi:hypothetical protein GWK47_005527 [Chionoecetes opilio]|uniref:POP1 C-terminal domain-containing protein n=1 Tax=Chionoecetes opilio TaxID=41210 RepID=A0A8J5CYX7_CHIOP|nr:hypothetical protein GWK47_005527 [Chionoecetes opilio]